MNDFISPLLLKLPEEFSKIIFLSGNFNIDFLIINNSVNNFIHILSSSYLLSHIRLTNLIASSQTQPFQKKSNQVISHQYFQIISHDSVFKTFFLKNYQRQNPISKNDGLLKILIKKTRNFPPNHRLPKVCQNSIKKKNNIYSKFLKSKN